MTVFCQIGELKSFVTYPFGNEVEHVLSSADGSSCN